MLTLTNFTKTLLLAASFLLLTACNSKSDSETNTTAEQNPTTETDINTGGTDDGTSSDEGSDDNATGGADDGTDGNTTAGTGGGNDDNTTTLPTVTLTSLKLTVDKTTLNKDENTTVKVMATYSDNSTKEVETGIEYLITPVNSVAVNGTTLTAKKDSNATVQAKVGTKLSNTLSLTIAWIVNGHVLPPEPDPAINNATLGGVDSNNNGVRDDVERNIYATYPVRLHRGLLMYGATVFQEIMIRPAEEAKETQKGITKTINCKLYLMGQDPEINSDEFDWVTFLENKTVNSKERVRKYLDYNIALSGGTYGSSPRDWNRESCSPEVIKALEEMGK